MNEKHGYFNFLIPFGTELGTDQDYTEKDNINSFMQ